MLTCLYIFSSAFIGSDRKNILSRFYTSEKKWVFGNWWKRSFEISRSVFTSFWILVLFCLMGKIHLSTSLISQTKKLSTKNGVSLWRLTRRLKRSLGNRKTNAASPYCGLMINSIGVSWSETFVIDCFMNKIFQKL